MSKRFYTTGFDSLATEPSPIRQSTALVLAEDYDRDIAQLKSKFHDTEILLRDVLEFGDVGFGMAERIKQHIILIKQEQKQ